MVLSRDQEGEAGPVGARQKMVHKKLASLKRIMNMYAGFLGPEGKYEYLKLIGAILS